MTRRGHEDEAVARALGLQSDLLMDWHRQLLDRALVCQLQVLKVMARRAVEREGDEMVILCHSWPMLLPCQHGFKGAGHFQRVVLVQGCHGTGDPGQDLTREKFTSRAVDLKRQGRGSDGQDIPFFTPKHVPVSLGPELGQDFERRLGSRLGEGTELEGSGHQGQGHHGIRVVGLGLAVESDQTSDQKVGGSFERRGDVPVTLL